MTLPAAVRDKLDMTGALQGITERGNIPVKGISYSGKWGEVDNADDLRVYQPTAS